MPRVTIIFGLLLILLGTGGFVASRDAGCLPPLIIGALLAGVGIRAQRAKNVRVAMHLSAAVAAIGMFGTASYQPALMRVILGQDLPHQIRIAVLAITGLLCFMYVTISVRAFLAARRANS